MKVVKGDGGYLRRQKNKAILITLLEFGVVGALLILGITQTGSRLNVLTVVAILGCLPAAKSMVGMIVLLPHKGIPKEHLTELEEKAPLLTKVYDMVITDQQNFMPIESMVILDNTICAYSNSKKIDANYTAKYLRKILESNHYNGVSVKIFQEYKPYITRAEGMNNMASVHRPDTQKEEQGMKKTLLQYSL